MPTASNRRNAITAGRMGTTLAKMGGSGNCREKYKQS